MNQEGEIRREQLVRLLGSDLFIQPEPFDTWALLCRLHLGDFSEAPPSESFLKRDLVKAVIDTVRDLEPEIRREVVHDVMRGRGPQHPNNDVATTRAEIAAVEPLKASHHTSPIHGGIRAHILEIVLIAVAAAFTAALLFYGRNVTKTVEITWNVGEIAAAIAIGLAAITYFRQRPPRG